ncbi:hypothetical protein ACFLZ1_03860 [Patescibacteria group bacterium]
MELNFQFLKTNFKKLLFIGFFACIFLFSFTPLSLALERTSDESVTVSASIPDEIAPTAPILIAPENGSFLSNPSPTFIFKKSYDAGSPVRHYVMYLNDSIFIPEIPSSQTPVENSQFLCIISEDLISVSIKSQLADGIYTWKIRAFDLYGNWVDSTTWTFTIDTQAPFLIITDIGENENLNLTSEDINSIPPGLIIETSQLQPKFKGRSEPGANIQINLIPLDNSYPTLTLTGIADSQGLFTLIPATKLNPGKYTVTAIASDAAANTTVLPEFTLLVLTPPTVPLLPSLPPPIFKKPEAVLELPQATPFLPSYLPFIPYLALLFLLLWLLVSKLAYGFPWLMLYRFSGLFLIPPILRKKRICLIFDKDKKRPVPFATVLVFQAQKKLKELLTDKKGLFNLKLKPGSYQLTATQYGFFPTTDTVFCYKKLKIALCTPLIFNSKTYNKYLFLKTLSLFFLILAFMFSVFGLLFWPNIISFAVFILCLDLLIAFLL